MPTIGYAVLPIVPSLRGAKKVITDELAGVGSEAGRQFGNDFSNAARSALNGVGTLIQAGTLAVTAFGAATAKAGVSFNALEQRSRAALSTLLGGAKQANQQMDSLNRLVQTSPFGKDIFIQAQQQLISFGRSAAQVVPDLKAINDTVAATGGGNQQLADLAFVMAQVSAAGKITGQDLIQFGQRGVNAAELIGEAMGKTGPEIKASITAGTLDANAALDALVQGMEDRFGGASDAVKQQFDGVSQRVSAQIRNLGSMLAQPFVTTTGGGELVDWLNKVGDILVALRVKFQPIYEEITARLQPAFDRVTAWLDDIRARLQGWDTSNVKGLIDGFQKFAPVLAAASAAMVAFSGHMLAGIPILGNLLGGINPVVAAIVAFAAASPEIRAALGSAFSDIASALAPVLPVVMDLVTTLADGLAPVIASVVSALGPLVQIVVSLLTPALVVLKPIIEAVSWTLEKIADVVSVVLSPLSVFANVMSGNATSTAIAAKAWSDAIDSARGLISGVGDLTGTLETNTKAFTDNTKEAIANYLSTHGLDNRATSDSGEPSALVQLRQWGVDTSIVVDGILGDASKFTEATDQINAAMLNTAGADLANSGLAAQLKSAGLGAQDLLDAANGVPTAVAAFQDAIAAQYDASAGLQHNQDLAQQGIDLLAQITSDTAQYGGALEYLGGQQQAASEQQQAAIDSMIAQGDVMGELNGKLEVNAEQWGKLAPSLADAGESGEHLTARMADLGFVAGESTSALAAAADAALSLGNASAAGAGGVDAMKDSLSALFSQASQINSNLTSALTGFVSPVGAWDAAVDAVNAKSGGGGGSRSSGTNPAVAAAQAALKAGQERAATTKKSAKAEQDAAVKAARAIRDAIVKQADADLKATRAAEKNARDRVSAAKKEADELKRIADDAAKRATDAQDRLESAQFAKRAADEALRAAQAGLASAETPEKRASWERAVAQALTDQATAAANLARAQQDAAQATQDAAASKAASEAATQRQADAETAYQAAQDASAATAESAADRKAKADDDYTKAKEKADLRYQKSVDAVQSMLDALTKKQDEARESAKNMASGASGAVGGMVAKIEPSLDQYLAQLRKQVDAQQNWFDNIKDLTSRLGPTISLQLAQLGPSAAPLVQKLVDGTDAQLQQFAALFPASTEQGVADMLAELVANTGIAAAQAAGLGQSVIDGFSNRLKSATTLAEVQSIGAEWNKAIQQQAAKYPITMKLGIDSGNADSWLRAWMQRKTSEIGSTFGSMTTGNIRVAGGMYADGGPITGPGTARSDSIPAWLSNGEHVWSAAEVDAAGGQSAVAMLRRAAMAGALRFADGGPVGSGERASVLGRTFQYIDQSTVYFPVAEPKSQMVNRKLSQDAALGGWLS